MVNRVHTRSRSMRRPLCLLIAAAFTAAGGGVGVAPASASAPAVTCQGQPATIVATADGQTITGTDGPDVMSSAGHLDVNVLAGGGDDLVCTDGGHHPNSFPRNSVHGGPGDDTLVASSAAPSSSSVAILEGEDGDDVLKVDAGLATLFPGPGDDTISVPQATARGQSSGFVEFDEQLPGVTIDVPAGTIDGEGHDTFTGSLGFAGTVGADVFEGGPGPDSFYDFYSGFDSPDPATDVVNGRGGDDVLESFHARIDGGAGDDSLTGGRGVLRGGPGSDHLHVEAGGRADGGAGADLIDTEIDDEDMPRIGLGRFDLAGGAGPDTILLTSPDGEGVSHVRCYSPSRCRFSADGGPGADVLSLEYIGGRAHLDLATGRGAFFGAHATVRRFEKVEGSPYADVLRGTAHADHLDGNGGPDRLFGRGGPDLLHGGEGHDMAFGGPGRDRCVAEVRHSC